MVYNLKNLKAAKVYEKDLEKIVNKVEEMLNFCNGLKHYKSMSRLKISLQEELKTLKKQLEQCRSIVENKGLTKDG